jgi:hypothetical protein
MMIKLLAIAVFATVVAMIASVVKAADIPSDPTMRCPQFEELFEWYGLPPDVFSYVAWRESRCLPDVVGFNLVKGMSKDSCKAKEPEQRRECPEFWSYDTGLLQVNSTWKSVTRRFCPPRAGQQFDMLVLRDVHCNLRVARYLYANGGLGHWSL